MCDNNRYVIEEMNGNKYLKILELSGDAFCKLHSNHRENNKYIIISISKLAKKKIKSNYKDKNRKKEHITYETKCTV